MRRLVLALALALAPIASQAGENASAAQTNAQDADEPTYAISTRTDRIGRVLAPVLINGKGPYRFLVDTGANRSVIGPRLAASMGLAPTAHAPSATVHGVTGSKVAPVVQVATLQADRLVLRNQELPVLDGGVLAGADGMFGVDGLAGRRLFVDFLNDRIEITSARQRVSLANAVTLKGRLHFGALLLTRAKIGAVPVAAVIDTGADRSVGNGALLRALRASAAPMADLGDVEFSGATGVTMRGRLIYLPSFQVGDSLEVARLPTVMADAHVFDIWGLRDEPAILVGMDILGQVEAMSIDYRRAELQLVFPASIRSRTLPASAILPNATRLRPSERPSKN